MERRWAPRCDCVVMAGGGTPGGRVRPTAWISKANVRDGKSAVRL